MQCSHSVLGTLYLQKLVLTSLTSGGRSVCIVRSLTQATEFLFYVVNEKYPWQYIIQILNGSDVGSTAKPLT
jgi:hypothetical protein